MVSVFLWPQRGQVKVAVRTVMQGILRSGPRRDHRPLLAPTATIAGVYDEDRTRSVPSLPVPLS